MKLSRVSVPGQVCCYLEGGSCTTSPGASDKGDLKHAGTSNTDIMIWANEVNEIVPEDPCIRAMPRLAFPIGMSSKALEDSWEDSKRIASDCEEDTIVVDSPETKGGRARLSVIREGSV